MLPKILPPPLRRTVLKHHPITYIQTIPTERQEPRQPPDSEAMTIHRCLTADTWMEAFKLLPISHHATSAIASCLGTDVKQPVEYC